MPFLHVSTLMTNIPTHFIDIPLASINIRDKSLCIRPECCASRNGQALLESIQEMGLLQAPLVQPRDDQTYKILSGRQRVEAVIRLGWENITCLCLAPHAPAMLKWKIILNHALLGSQLSFIEQALFFEKAGKELARQDLVTLLTLLGWKASNRVLERMEKALLLTPAAITALHLGYLHEKNIDLVETLSDSDQETLVRLIGEYKLGGSKQRNLLVFASDLSRRHNCSARTIIERWEQSRNRGGDENKPQLVHDLFTWFSQQLSPRLYREEQQFNKLVQAMELPPSCSLRPTRAFEDTRLSLTIQFMDHAHFIKQWESIRKVLESNHE